MGRTSPAIFRSFDPITHLRPNTVQKQEFESKSFQKEIYANVYARVHGRSPQKYVRSPQLQKIVSQKCQAFLESEVNPQRKMLLSHINVQQIEDLVATDYLNTLEVQRISSKIHSRSPPAYHLQQRSATVQGDYRDDSPVNLSTEGTIKKLVLLPQR